MAFQTRTVSTQTSSADRALTGVLAALVMFVAGYTVVRVSLAQPVTGANADAAATAVIPHEAELWSDLAK